MSRLLIPSVLLFLVAVCGWAQTAKEVKSIKDWPQWRGPNRDVVSADTGLLKEWPKDGPRLLWETKGLGRGYSSIALAGGKVFTLGDRAGKQFLIALDESSRKELWAAEVGRTWSDGGPRSTPTVDGALVYALGPHGDLIAAETATGKVRWRKSLPKDFRGQMMSGWGYSESPLVDGENLICTPGGSEATLVALNKQTGALVWKTPVPADLLPGKSNPDKGNGAGYASPVVAEPGGLRQYVQLLGGGIVGVAARDGKLLWHYTRIANGTANIPTPIVRDNLIFCSTGYHTGSALLRLAPSGQGTRVEEVYFLDGRRLQNHHGGLVLVGEHIFGGHGHNNGFPICVELKTGKVVWGGDTRGPGSGSAAVVYADGNLYFRYQDGLMALIEATPRGSRFTEKGTFKIPHSGGAPSWSHPVVNDGKLYLREQDWLLCYDLKAG